MFFIFKKKVISIDAFCCRQKVFDLFKIKKSNNFIPQWWKNLPQNNNDPVNMRGCSGFADLYQNGFMVPLWSEFRLFLDDNDKFIWEFADKITNADIHPNYQYGEYLNETYHHIKFYNPWLLSTKSNLKVFFSNPSWNNQKPSSYFTPPGIITFGKNFTQPNVNLFFKLHDRKFCLEPGTPLIHLMFLTDKKIIFNYHIIDIEEWNNKRNQNNIRTFFTKNNMRERLLYRKNERET